MLVSFTVSALESRRMRCDCVYSTHSKFYTQNNIHSECVIFQFSLNVLKLKFYQIIQIHDATLQYHKIVFDTRSKKNKLKHKLNKNERLCKSCHHES